MTRKITRWKFRDSSLDVGERTLIAGILNVTPDSFSDGGKYAEPEAALHRALQLQEEGADLIDIGAESTRPGSERISEAEENRRLMPVLKKLKGRLDIPISVDTYKPGVAELALGHGAQIINDVSGLTWNPDLAKVVLNHNAGLILNHMRGTPDQWARLGPMRDVMGEIVKELEAAVHRARRAGIDLDHIVIDPGIGFGKRKEQNSEIIARLRELNKLLLPVMIGVSRKSFLAQESPEDSVFATAGAVAAAVLSGAALVRVHDVRAMRAVIDTVDAVVNAIPERAETEKRTRPQQDDRPRIAESKPRASVTPRGERPDKPEDRPALTSGRPPRREWQDKRDDRPPQTGDRPPRREWQSKREDRPAATGERPPRREWQSKGESGPPGTGGRPPRREWQGKRDDRPPQTGDRPPRREWQGKREDRPAATGERPPRREWQGKGDDRPRGTGERPPRRQWNARGDDRKPWRGPEQGGNARPGGRSTGGRRGPSTPRKRP